MQFGKKAGGYRFNATAGQDIIPVLKQREKTHAEANNQNFYDDAFHISDICIEAAANTTFSINGGTSISIPSTGIYSNCGVLIKTLIIDQATTINIAYNY